MLQVLDLFAGAGGLSLGLRESGFQTVAAIDQDSDSAETFARHHPAADVRVARVDRVDLSEWTGRVDLVCGGPPCQPYSSGGHRRGTTDERDGVPDFLDAVRAVRPRAVLLENVPGLAVGSRRKVLAHILDALRADGFTVCWQILPAADYGVAQSRRRLMVVGVRTGTFVFPPPTHGPGTPHGHVRAGAVVTSDAVGEPNLSRVTYARNPQLRPNPYHGLLFNGGGRALDADAPAPTILASAGGNKTPFVDTLGVVPAYHAHLLSGGTPRQGDVPGARRLTVREVARLQTFSDETVFAGRPSSQYRQIGNAVPPRLAAAVGRALRESLHAPARRRVVVQQPVLFDR